MKKTKKTKVPMARFLTWKRTVNEYSSLETAAGKTLMLFLGRISKKHPITVMALEGKTCEMGSDAFLDNHSHDLIGEYKTRKLAIAAASSYAVSWARGLVRGDKCECKPIGTIRKPKMRRQRTPPRSPATA